MPAHLAGQQAGKPTSAFVAGERCAPVERPADSTPVPRARIRATTPSAVSHHFRTAPGHRGPASPRGVVRARSPRGRPRPGRPGPEGAQEYVVELDLGGRSDRSGVRLARPHTRDLDACFASAAPRRRCGSSSDARSLEGLERRHCEHSLVEVRAKNALLRRRGRSPTRSGEVVGPEGEEVGGLRYASGVSAARAVDHRPDRDLYLTFLALRRTSATTRGLFRGSGQLHPRADQVHPWISTGERRPALIRSAIASATRLTSSRRVPHDQANAAPPAPPHRLDLVHPLHGGRNFFVARCPAPRSRATATRTDSSYGRQELVQRRVE